MDLIRLERLRRLKKLHRERTLRYKIYTNMFNVFSSKTWTDNYAACYCGEFSEKGCNVRKVDFERENFYLRTLNLDFNAEDMYVRISIQNLNSGEVLFTKIFREETPALAIAAGKFPQFFNSKQPLRKNKEDWL